MQRFRRDIPDEGSGWRASDGLCAGTTAEQCKKASMPETSDHQERTWTTWNEEGDRTWTRTTTGTDMTTLMRRKRSRQRLLCILDATDTETLRRVSKLCKATVEAQCGRTLFLQHFPKAAASLDMDVCRAGSDPIFGFLGRRL